MGPAWSLLEKREGWRGRELTEAIARYLYELAPFFGGGVSFFFLFHLSPIHLLF